MTDTELLDKLEAMAKEGFCPTLAYDDEGNWAVNDEGMSPAGPKCSQITAYFEPEWWKPSIREAIRDYIERSLSHE